MRRIGLLVGVGFVFALLLVSSAHAFIYWASSQDAKIGRANNDGTGVDKHLISTRSLPFAVAVNSAHIYWANQNGNSIGRANLDGSGVNNNFINVPEPSGVAVTGSYIFWTSITDSAVGRANLNGSNRQRHLIPTTTPCGAAVDSGHVYWVEDGGTPSLIGRASFAGDNVSQSWVTIPGISFPCGVAVNTANIFWADSGFFGGGTNIGRANTSTGMGADASTIGDASTPCGVAVNTNHLYWANAGTNTIGRARTDSTGVNQSFVHTGGDQICGVAVDSLAPPETTIDAATIRGHKRKATFEFSASDPGSTFECRLDDRAYRGCSSPKTYTRLHRGRHTFRVKAESPQGAVDPTAAKRTFRIRR
jgi:streptogramin lyase